MTRSLRQILSVPALIVIAIFVLPGAGSFTESEFLCEEAAVNLEDCCEDLAVESLSCSRQTGCSGETTRPPVLTAEESECIKELGCRSLNDANICERVSARQFLLEQDDTDAFETGAVCP